MYPIKEISALYKKYGFDEGIGNDKFLTFLSQEHYFSNAEIVVLDPNSEEINVQKQEYEEMGYSVRVKNFHDLKFIHNALFDGFFRVKSSNAKLMREYHEFCEKQSQKVLGNQYEYISGSYFENGYRKDDNIIERIQELYGSDGQQLIILEAAAGFGKTCTSFEVIKSLVEKYPQNIPLITELSKNRKANLFRYVLLSEIDQKFPTLNGDLVTYEIGEGRIFVIIDGFDELLSKSCSSISEPKPNNDVQTMLDTISQLFTNGAQTKVLLTSRKSSIFVGEKFEEWTSTHLQNCNVTRLQLELPSLIKWLGNEKLEILKSKNINIEDIYNPVLLSLLRSEDLSDIDTKYSNSDDLVNQYLNLMLSREKTRQSLPLQVDEQLSIIRKLASLMVQYDISSEEIKFIKDLLNEIVADHIDEYIHRYEAFMDPTETKPTADEFLNKLSHHALLDRISMQSNQVGFVNEFIFGQMIVESIKYAELPLPAVTGKYLDLAITALRSSSQDKKHYFYEKLLSSIKAESSLTRLNASLALLNSVPDTYVNEYLDGIYFGKNVLLKGKDTFKNCIFADCIFNNCEIDTDAFDMCQFYNCSFYNTTIFSGLKENCHLIFLSCVGHEEFAEAACRHVPDSYDDVNYERLVLEQFWKPGYEIAEPRRGFQTLLKGVAPDKRTVMLDAVTSLLKRGVLIKKARVMELNFEKIEEIKNIIDR